MIEVKSSLVVILSFQSACHRFKKDIQLWLTFIEFLKKEVSFIQEELHDLHDSLSSMIIPRHPVPSPQLYKHMEQNLVRDSN